MMRQDARVRAAPGAGRPPADLPAATAPPMMPGLAVVPDLPAIEQEVLSRWSQRQVLARSAGQTADGPPWSCLVGPTAAAGVPGVHHLRASAVRDLYQRFKTMQGFRVPRGTGWDCHGLAVEVAVEKELGLAGLADIGAYGPGRFAARCREWALRHAGAHAALIARIGQQSEPREGCQTMDPGYVESVWACVDALFGAGLLVRDERVAPCCPRCQTPLSERELAHPAGTRRVIDTEVTLRLPVTAVPDGASSWLRGADLLVSTTAPWSLVASAAVAVHPHHGYVVARRPGHDDRLVVAEAALTRVLGEGWHVVARLPGTDLAGTSCRPPFGQRPASRSGASELPVIPGYFVAPDRGTGLVPVAPAFGGADLAAAREHGLGVVSPLTADGRFDLDVPLVGGMFFKDADPVLIEALSDLGQLLSARREERAMAHCWRCGTPLLWRATPAWYVRTSMASKRLLTAAAEITWVPAPAAHSSDGDWLRSGADWVVSRTRYWGTPLPLWECQAGHLTCVPSLASLSELAGRDLTGMDPHRPGIDAVTIACPQCGGTGRRVPEVCDSAFDVGALPFAMSGQIPGVRSGIPAGLARSAWRADLVAEDADDGASVFYALAAVGTLIAGRPAFGTALCLGPVLDDNGVPMSGGTGNLTAPLPLIERHGADAVRWLLAAATPPSAARRVSDAALDEVVRKVLLPYWSAAEFYIRYANAAAARSGRRPDEQDAPPPAARPVLDRWLLGELASLADEVTAALDCYQSATAGRRIAAFIEDLSAWYLRGSRRRFRQDPGTADGAAAFATLHTCLATLSRLMAPITPFVTDYVWDAIRSGAEPDSVHLSRWPGPAEQKADERLADKRLAEQMALVRRVAGLGRSARSAARIRWRQPLARAVVSADGFAEIGAELRALLAQKLNVRTIECGPTDGARPDGRFPDGDPLPCGPTTTAKPTATASTSAGWAIASDGDAALALDAVITAELRREGLAREAIGVILDARKAAGLGVADRIALHWSASDAEVALALSEHGPMVAAGALAVEYGAVPAGRPLGAGFRKHRCAELDLAFWIRPLDR